MKIAKLFSFLINQTFFYLGKLEKGFEILDSETKRNSDTNQIFYRCIDEAFFD